MISIDVSPWIVAAAVAVWFVAGGLAGWLLGSWIKRIDDKERGRR